MLIFCNCPPHRKRAGCKKRRTDHLNLQLSKGIDRHKTRFSEMAQRPLFESLGVSSGTLFGLIQTFGADTLPVVAVAGGMRFQSIDVGEVANHLGSVFAPLV